ncbi:MAG: DUF1501 domain-containing protein [Bacteroidota bacterium]|nr:DUF1501 domain-containing protein [Bacteroidota bacterium]
MNKQYFNNIHVQIKRLEFLYRCALVSAAFLLGSSFGVNAAQPVEKPHAKSVIFIYLDGGPAQTDMFDPKPKAGKDYTGPYVKPIATNVAGIEIGEKLPLLAKIADKYSIIRSMTHGINGHETASYVMETGSLPGGRVVYPSMGAVIAFKKESTYTGSIPSYISLTVGSSRFNEAGFLGPQYKSFATGGAPEAAQFSVEGIVNNAYTDEQLHNRQKLLNSLDHFSSLMPGNAQLDEMDKYQKQAYSLILGEDRKVFNLNEEGDSLRNHYGRNRLGQSCLIARRLVQKGVLFVMVRNTGWDTHKEHFERMNEKLPELDQALSALLTDLSDKGLLDQTIVICGGEFGRTPKILFEPPWNGGRNHFGAAFSYLVAGGGFIGGKVVGATDAKGEKVIERPVYPWDFAESIYTLMGIDTKSTLPHPTEGNIPMLYLPQDKDKRGGMLTEIMKQ